MRLTEFIEWDILKEILLAGVVEWQTRRSQKPVLQGMRVQVPPPAQNFYFLPPQFLEHSLKALKEGFLEKSQRIIPK